ncbi:MAG: PDDEXK nuclease domain-containing protein [Gammaproteobacteria bacterium]|jgi:hypothetical protein
MNKEIITKEYRQVFQKAKNAVGLLDDYVKQPDENPSIGLILCADKNSVEADYALRDLHKPIGISEITLSKVLPANLVNKLPDAKLLENEILQELKEAKKFK